METLSQPELDALLCNGRPVGAKSGYPAIVLHPDGTVTKLFSRRKPWWSSATWRPYSSRFVRNVERLAALGVTVPRIIRHARLAHSHVHVVTYVALTGSSIRELLSEAPRTVDIPALCLFIDSLHERGIAFRGMHLGNILRMPEGHGLIDVTDVRFKRRPLTAAERLANMRVPLQYEEDMALMELAGLPALADTYVKVTGATSSAAAQLRSAQLTPKRKGAVEVAVGD